MAKEKQENLERVMTDTGMISEPLSKPPSEPPKQFVEYMGSKQYGVEFTGQRIITRRDAKRVWDISIPKDLVWTKNAKGRMLLPRDTIPEEALEILLQDPKFKVVES